MYIPVPVLPPNIIHRLGNLHVSISFWAPSFKPLWPIQHKCALFLQFTITDSSSLEPLALTWAHMMSFNKHIINANQEMSKNFQNACSSQLMPQVFSMKDNSVADMVADDHLALHYLWAREGEFCSPRRAACCMWVEYTGKVPLVTQMRQQIKINNNNVIEIFEQNSRTILTHFPGSLKIPGDDRIPMLFRSFIILFMCCLCHVAFQLIFKVI